MKRARKKPLSKAARAAMRANIVAFRATNPNPALKHGVRSEAVKAGKLPKGFEELQDLVDGFYDGWVADLGGEQNLTNAKRALLWVSRGCLAIFALGLEHVKAEGLVDEAGDVQPVTKILGTYANSLRLNLAAAGLERVPRNVTKTLEAKLEEIAAKEQGADEGKA
ncbi:MAG: hypothetical protein ACRD5M_05025 [Candidatus Acidiferrales bacterium]